MVHTELPLLVEHSIQPSPEASAGVGRRQFAETLHRLRKFPQQHHALEEKERTNGDVIRRASPSGTGSPYPASPQGLTRSVSPAGTTTEGQPRRPCLKRESSTASGLTPPRYRPPGNPSRRAAPTGQAGKPYAEPGATCHQRPLTAAAERARRRSPS